LFDKLIGQSIDSVSGKMVHGDFAFGNILYFEGAIAFLLYVIFVISRVRKSVRIVHHLNSYHASIIYFNIFAIIVYFTSLVHYGNAINLGVANLSAIHIAINLVIIKQAKSKSSPTIHYVNPGTDAPPLPI
jgi:hypothetical protein